MTDPTSHNSIETYITRTPGVCGGKPCIAGRRIPVQNVYIWYEYNDSSPDEIANEHDLSLAQVHAALAFAYEHIDEIRESTRQAEELVETLKKQYPSALRHKYI